MARYFFHFRNGAEFIEDLEGLELASANIARTRGVESLRDVLAGDVLWGILDCGASIEIEDEQHRRVADIVCDDALTIIR